MGAHLCCVAADGQDHVRKWPVWTFGSLRFHIFLFLEGRGRETAENLQIYGNTRTATSSSSARPAGIRKRRIWCPVGVAVAARGFLFVDVLTVGEEVLAGTAEFRVGDAKRSFSSVSPNFVELKLKLTRSTGRFQGQLTFRQVYFLFLPQLRDSVFILKHF